MTVTIFSPHRLHDDALGYLLDMRDRRPLWRLDLESSAVSSQEEGESMAADSAPGPAAERTARRGPTFEGEAA